jgi:hypothetical protein
MSSHHDHDNQLTEPKPVAFGTPLILALVTVLIILLGVSTCDNKKHSSCECKEDCSEECMKKCESGDHSGHATETHSTEHAAEAHEVVAAEGHAAAADTLAKTDTAAVKVENNTPTHH